MTIQEMNKVLDKIGQLAEHAMAHAIISTRADEANEYLHKYNPPDSLGRNIWHAILDDAIRMRELLDANK